MKAICLAFLLLAPCSRAVVVVNGYALGVTVSAYFGDADNASASDFSASVVLGPGQCVQCSGVTIPGGTFVQDASWGETMVVVDNAGNYHTCVQANWKQYFLQGCLAGFVAAGISFVIRAARRGLTMSHV